MNFNSKGTFGEALAASVALAGFIFLLATGRIQTIVEIWLFTYVLIVVVVFYFLLLLVRALFTFLVGGDTFWWEKYEQSKNKKS